LAARDAVDGTWANTSAAETAEQIQQLDDEGYPLSEIAKQLNHEGYKPAKQERFTPPSIGALCRMLRRRKLIAPTPNTQPHCWRAGKQCEALSIKKPTLSWRRRRAWLQVRQVGSRWIYWADPAEFERLKKLANYPPSGSIRTPAELTTPLTRMRSAVLAALQSASADFSLAAATEDSRRACPTARAYCERRESAFRIRILKRAPSVVSANRLNRSR
jgi:hypothetical protein